MKRQLFGFVVMGLVGSSVFCAGIKGGVYMEQERSWTEGRKVVDGRYLVGGDLRGWTRAEYRIAQAVEREFERQFFADTGTSGLKGWSTLHGISRTTKEPVVIFQIYQDGKGDGPLLPLSIRALLEAAEAHRQGLPDRAATLEEYDGVAVEQASHVILQWLKHLAASGR